MSFSELVKKQPHVLEKLTTKDSLLFLQKNLTPLNIPSI